MEECLQVKLEKLSPLPSNCCIYRVPERLHQINEKAYTPQLPFFILEDLFALAAIEIPDQHENPTIITVTYEYFKGLEAEKQEGQQYHKGKTAPSVTDLHQAGVHFSLSKSNDLFAIEFKNRTLHIPKLKLQLETESLFRNLIAFEQRHYSENYINDYVFLIHHLVNTAKDVELLVQNGIIENWLPDKEAASTLINNLSRGTTLLADSFYFSGLCKAAKD
ncbi:hypothetical protein WN944_024055 [Citrus x changshan-huyou]|uniref:Uncharacterized protein n=1 Tax=Citrus x changshan-huyou TaxID=2935761 RepID=A0AAP0QBN1_9ROSI